VSIKGREEKVREDVEEKRGQIENDGGGDG
jgi:hypothetical protein